MAAGSRLSRLGHRLVLLREIGGTTKPFLWSPRTARRRRSCWMSRHGDVGGPGAPEWRRPPPSAPRSRCDAQPRLVNGRAAAHHGRRGGWHDQPRRSPEVGVVPSRGRRSTADLAWEARPAEGVPRIAERSRWDARGSDGSTTRPACRSRRGSCDRDCRRPAPLLVHGGPNPPRHRRLEPAPSLR